MDFTTIVHINQKVDTIEKFIVKYRINISPRKGETQKIATQRIINSIYNKNKVAIQQAYIEEQDKEPQISSGYQDHFLRTPVPIEIDSSILLPEIIKVQGSVQIENENFVGFFMPKIDQLLKSEEYRQTKIEYNKNTLKSQFIKPTVWLWSKALSSLNGELSGQLINISPFIQSLNTSTGENGGNFSFTLPPIIGELTDQGWVISSKNIHYIINKKKDIIEIQYLAEGHIHKNRDSRENSSLFFNNIIANNDLVFISFDKIDYSIDNNNPLRVDYSEISKGLYDMIGLVDISGESTNYEDNNVNISIQGKDASKLLIEDGSFNFWNYYSPKDPESIFLNTSDSQSRSKLRFNIAAAPTLIDLMNPNEFQLDFLMRYLISKLSNIQVCPDEVFSSYSYEEKSRFYDITNVKDTKTIKEITGAGIWQIIKLFIDKSASGRNPLDLSLTNFSGSLLNFVNRLCQKPFVEFSIDTYGNEIYFIVRKQPFDEQGFKNMIPSNLDLITIKTQDVYRDSLSFETQAFSWFELTPQDGILDANNQKYLPAIYYPEFAEVYGSKPYSISTNYLASVLSFFDNQKGSDYFKSILQDLQYLVQSNIYLPFTRKGTITLFGNRGWKRGMWIYYAPTNEFYYIDSVSQSYGINEKSIDRTTTLNVSRGMKANYCGLSQFTEGELLHNNQISNTVLNKSIFPTYWNVVNFKINRANFAQQGSDGAGYIAGNVIESKVNKEVFNFFQKRRQMK